MATDDVTLFNRKEVTMMWVELLKVVIVAVVAAVMDYVIEQSEQQFSFSR